MIQQGRCQNRFNRDTFRLAANIYLPTQLYFYVSTDLPVHQPTNSVNLVTSSLPGTASQLGLSTHRPTYPKVNLPFHLNAFLPANHSKTQYIHPRTHRCTRSSTYLFISILSFRLTAVPTCPLRYCSTYPQTHPLRTRFINLPVRFKFPFQLNKHMNYLSTHLLVCLPTGIPKY